MSTLSIVLLTVIVVLALVGIGKALYDWRKKGGGTLPIDKIAPIVAEAMTAVAQEQAAEKLGFDALETWTVNYIKAKIDGAAFLTDSEKALFTTDLIKSLIDKELRKLYGQGA